MLPKHMRELRTSNLAKSKEHDARFSIPPHAQSFLAKRAKVCSDRSATLKQKMMSMHTS